MSFFGPNSVFGPNRRSVLAEFGFGSSLGLVRRHLPAVIVYVLSFFRLYRLQEETARVEDYLGSDSCIERLILCFLDAKAVYFDNILDVRTLQVIKLLSRQI